MSELNNIIKISPENYQKLVDGGFIKTKDSIYKYDENAIYLVEDESTCLNYEAGNNIFIKNNKIYALGYDAYNKGFAELPGVPTHISKLSLTSIDYLLDLGYDYYNYIDSDGTMDDEYTGEIIVGDKIYYVQRSEYIDEDEFAGLVFYVENEIEDVVDDAPCVFLNVQNNTASGYYSHAEGRDTSASGIAAHAEGGYTTASGWCSHAEGRYNVSLLSAIHIVGIGTDSERKNAHTITNDGKHYIPGIGNYLGTETTLPKGQDLATIIEVEDYELEGVMIKDNEILYKSNNNQTVTPNSLSYTTNEYDSYGIMTNNSPYTSIGIEAFRGCSSLTSVTIPNSVTSIGSLAFYNCSGLTSVTIPISITSIGDNAFYGCSSLPVTDNCRYADTYLVEAVDKTLSTYTIKDGTRFIGYRAFSGCSSLTSVTIPNSVTSIGNTAFRDCNSLASVTIGNNVTSIGLYAFYNCSSLTSPIYNAHVFAFMPTTYSGAYTIPDGIESIAGGAFQNCRSMTSITIPNSVTSIGKDAFSYCTSLTSVTIPNSVTSIGVGVFYDCSGLISVVYNGNTYTSISQLTSSLANNGVTVGNGAFSSTGLSN